MNEPYSHYILSGVKLDSDFVDLGHGVSLSRTYVHLMAHPMIAFKPAEQGMPSPGPWQSVVAQRNSTSVDLLADLAVPRDGPQSTLHHEWASWITFLLRFMTDSIVTMTLVSSLDGSGLADGEAIQESASLASRAILRIIELNRVPDKDYLERELLAPSTQ